MAGLTFNHQSGPVATCRGVIFPLWTISMEETELFSTKILV